MRKVKGKKSKFSNDFIAIAAMAGFIFIILSCYAIDWFYSSYVGELELEVAYNVEVEVVVETQGYVIRDEYQQENGAVVSIINTSDSAYYYPIISDGTSINNGGTIAYTFSNEAQAELYYESLLIQQQIDYLSDMPTSYDVEYLSVDSTISKINEEVLAYIEIINSNDLTDISSQADSVNSQIVTKKTIMGESYDYSSEIASLQTQLYSLESQINILDEIQAPYAGYFVSTVDGYEGLVDFDTVEDIDLDAAAVTELINSTPTEVDNALGKIIAQHIWYLACNLNTSDVLTSNVSFTVGSTVYVDFTDEYIFEIPMEVVSVSSTDGNGNIAVLLKCTYMNQDLATLRIENVSFSINSYEGLKINKDAVFINEDGVAGVYVLLNSTVTYTPIVIEKTQDDYVIASAYYVDEDEDGYADDRQLTAYDQIIVQGRNLQDGKFID